MVDKQISLGTRLHYPITITKLLKKPGDSIKRQERIAEYKFTWRRKIDEDKWSDETTYTEYDSPAEGVLKEWRIEEGEVIKANSACMVVEEACGHEIQIQGMCGMCGADMTEIDWASEDRDTSRAMINMAHDQTDLLVSENVAERTEHEAQKRLLRQRKLSLVVDLDQTIIHACIDPTVREWQNDPTSPNYEAVSAVKSFVLDDGPRGTASGCTYFIKLRPFLFTFLEEMSRMYEMHVYTMGTRAYALNIARIVDPDQKLFGNRIISRDENGSITSKSLQRLFPVSTDMVVIMDDRSDVWPMNRANLIKVVPYDFFKGIGDINSSFLPKRQDLAPTPPPASNGASEDVSNDESNAVSESKAAESSNNAGDPANGGEVDEQMSLKVQAEEQEKTLEKQLTDRPLQHMQEELDREDEEATQEDSATGDSHVAHHRPNLLSDDDEELIGLQDHLTDLHSAFYEAYDRRREERKKGGDPTYLPGHKVRHKSVDDGVDLSLVPDIGDILDELKSNVLSGLVIVLSGLVPLGVRIEDSEIGSQALAFGAQVLDNVSRRATHLVVSTSRPRTKKVQQAAKIPSIRIVSQNWLADCLAQWRRLDERPYLMKILDADRARSNDVTEPASEDDEATVRDLKDIDWDAADKEINELLGLDDDDDDEDDEEDNDKSGDRASTDATDSEAESDADAAKRGAKRKAQVDGDNPGESILAKKQRVARNRGASGLRAVRTPNGNGDEGDEDGSSLPTPVPTGDEEADTEKPDPGDDFDEDELERDLLAEFEAAGAE